MSVNGQEEYHPCLKCGSIAVVWGPGVPVQCADCYAEAEKKKAFCAIVDTVLKTHAKTLRELADK